MTSTDTHYPDCDSAGFSSEENSGNVEHPIALDADAIKVNVPKAKKKLGFWKVLLYIVIIAAAIFIAFVILRFIF